MHILGYFTNLVLLAAFLGLGIGVARRTGGPRLPLFALTAFTALVLCTLGLQIFPLDVTAPNVGYFINEIGPDVDRHARVPLYPAIALVFLAAALAFVPLGQLVGRALAPLPVLRGYSINVLGSLVGIAAFAGLSVSRLPPAAWVAFGVLLLTWFVKPRLLGVSVAVVLGLLTVAAERVEAARANARISWSPYYKIHVLDIPPPVGGHIVQVNNNFLLCALDLTAGPEAPEFLKRQNAYYSLPYAFVKPKSVLVLGAGAGNDVQMALLRDVGSVTAVEIDPAVARMGRSLHPKRPLADPRVQVVVEDARSFLQRDTGTYDVIVFGTLDSHGLFSSMGSVRMENFVYTEECFRSAAARLSADGVLVVCVGPMADWVHARIVRTIEAATGGAAEVYYFSHFLRPADTSNLGIVAGPGAAPREDVPQWEHLDVEARRARWAAISSDDPIATDDWPNVFLRGRSLPREYLVVLALVLGIGALLVRAGSGGAKLQGEFAMLGAGFMLLETRSITEMGLVFGVTWVVSSLVISLILVVILAATLASERRTLPRMWTYPLLIASLLTCLQVPTEALLAGSSAARILLSALYVGAPILLASLVFADAYRAVPDVRPAFASNLLGAVLGGVLEYGSLVWGMKAAFIVAIAAYVMAMVLGLRTHWRRPSLA